MEKRLIFAIVLSIVVLVGFNIYFASQTKKIHPQDQSVPVSSGQQPAQKEITGQNIHRIHKKEEKVALEKIKFEERDIEINTDLLKVVFSTKGGKIKNWILKNYKREEGEQIDLAGGLSIDTGIFDSFEFKPTASKIDLTKEKNNEARISFIYDSKDTKITKEFLFKNGSYKLECSVKIDNISKNEIKLNNFVISWGPGLGTPEKLKEFEELKVNTFIDEKIKKDKIKKISERIENKGKVSWVALSKKFFVVALIPNGVDGDSSIIKREFIKGKEVDTPTVIAGLKIPDFTIQPGVSHQTNFFVYAGPSILENLRELKIHKVLDFGWFSGLGILFLVVLKFFYRLAGNFGLAIILLTILIKLILWLPTDRSMKSMKSMQKLQPHMNTLREKHKNNPQQLNSEVLKLYKTHKVNPLGGCLPMILQIPVFYALYMILVNAVELRGEPFYFWIKDLSVKDPYYIIPIFMGATMFIQQKMTPAPDPNQAKIMLILPVVFTFMFINLPSGVVLYWTFQNILSIIQQYHINKQ